MSFRYDTFENWKLVEKWGFKNYTDFFREMKLKNEVRYAIRNSFLFGINDLLLLSVSLVFSYFFYKKIRGSSVFRIIFFLPSVISIVIYVVVYKEMFVVDGPIDTLLELIGIENAPQFDYGKDYLVVLIMFYCLWVGTGYNILIMGGAMANLPEEVMEYSRLEGVGYVSELFRVVLPMIWPTISVAILGSLTTMFTLFIQVDLLTGGSGGDNNQAYTIAFMINKSISSGSSAALNYASTIGVFFTVIATPIVIIVRKALDKLNDRFGA
jgi:raffinose/stachyose/melibiose transport system permease protein